MKTHACSFEYTKSCFRVHKYHWLSRSFLSSTTSIHDCRDRFSSTHDCHDRFFSSTTSTCDCHDRVFEYTEFPWLSWSIFRVQKYETLVFRVTRVSSVLLLIKTHPYSFFEYTWSFFECHKYPDCHDRLFRVVWVWILVVLKNALMHAHDLRKLGIMISLILQRKFSEMFQFWGKMKAISVWAEILKKALMRMIWEN